jgi:excisionase family DNA binding protein
VPGKHKARFTALRVQYLVHTYGLRSRFERLRDRGMLTKKEMAVRLGIHELTLVRWVEHGIIKAHAYTKNRRLYEEPKNLPKKHCSRWERLVDRAAAMRNPTSKRPRPVARTERGAV